MPNRADDPTQSLEGLDSLTHPSLPYNGWVRRGNPSAAASGRPYNRDPLYSGTLLSLRSAILFMHKQRLPTETLSTKVPAWVAGAR